MPMLLVCIAVNERVFNTDDAVALVQFARVSTTNVKMIDEQVVNVKQPDSWRFVAQKS